MLLQHKFEVRPVKEDDLESLKIVLDSIELFPSAMLDHMISDYLKNNDSPDIWFTATQENTPVSIGYCAPEKLTDGTYNLYAIGVRADKQGMGAGRAMMAYIEKLLTKTKQRILLVETSSADQFSRTRSFYEKLQYHKEAQIREFWSAGEDKIIYWKKLQ